MHHRCGIAQPGKNEAKYCLKRNDSHCFRLCGSQVDLAACAAAGIKVARVPVYSPTSVAEHALAMMTTLNR